MRNSAKFENTNPPSPTAHEYECPDCKDENGYLVHEMARDAEGNEYRKDYWRVCECVERKRVARLFRSSNITEAFRQITFDDFTLEGRPKCVHSAYHAVRDYVDHFDEIRRSDSNSIALLGKPGSGKTHLLIAASNVLINRGVGVLYFPWAEGSDEILQASREDDDTYSKRIEAMKHVDVLFIDDLFKGRTVPTDFQMKWLFAVINYRYLNNLPMFISSERTANKLRGIDDAIERRIYERSGPFLIEMLLDKSERGMHLNYSHKDDEP